ncbi:hypothetical protein H6775_01335 [Candidatus Nomurabacteria bacterium]|nr:hypothetical protein [Candidatus Nomurabacteria bacterium]
MTTKNTKKGGNTGKVALAAAAFLALAGAAFLYGTKEGKVQRKKIKGWALKAKGEILDKLEDAKEISEDNYKKIVEGVGAKYKKVKKVQDKELDVFMKEMKGHWNRIKKEMEEKKPAKATKTK